MGTLQALCEFYDADWSGIVDADLQLGVWTPIWWYNADKKGMTETRLYSVDISEGFGRWEDALNQGKSISVLDVEDIKSTNLIEYEQYRRMEVSSVLGAPYQKRSKGFLIVRNPKRFRKHISFLEVLTYVVASEVASEHKEKVLKSLRFQHFWCVRLGSNQRPSESESDALSN